MSEVKELTRQYIYESKKGNFEYKICRCGDGSCRKYKCLTCLEEEFRDLASEIGDF